MDEGRLSFVEFYDTSFGTVCRGLSVALGDARRAEEAAQEAFTRAYVRWRRVSQMERPAGWVYVTAVRVATRSRRTRYAGIHGQEAVEDPAERVVQRTTLGEAVDALPERQRLAIVLRYALDLSIDDVAAAMGCAPGTVKSTLHAALARLRAAVGETGEEVLPDAVE